MTQLNKIILSSLILSSSCFANNGSTLLEELEGTKTYVGIQTGYSHLNVDKEDTGSLTLNESLDKSGSNISFELGYSYSKNIDLSLNYKRVNNSDIGLDNFYVSSKYKFNYSEVFTPYIGANLGYSQLSWDRSPISTTDNDVESGSFMIGALAGILYPINKNLSLDINYQTDYMEHKTYLENYPNKSTLTHDLLQTFNFGFRYSF